MKRKKWTEFSEWMKQKTKSLRFLVGTSMSLVAVTTLLLFVWIMIFVIRGTLISGVKTNAEQTTHISYVTMTNKHAEMIRKASVLADEIQHTNQNLENLKERMSIGYRLNDDIVSLSLFDEEGALSSHAPSHYSEKEEINLFQQSWFEEPDDPYTFTFSNPHIQELFKTPYKWVVTLTRKISIDGTPYYLVIDYDFSTISAYINRVFIGKRGYSFILDKNNQLIYHPNQRMAQNMDEKEIVNMIETKGDGVYVTPSEKYVMAYQTVPQSHWKVVGVSDLEDTLRPALNEIWTFTFWAFVLIFGCIVLFSSSVSKMISSPITAIVSVMKNPEGKGLPTRLKENGYNEVGELSRTYNHLLDQVERLMKTIKEEQTELRHSEMKVLQSQMNPHFLYNTLDSILWMSESGKQNETSQMVDALGKLMRISLSKGDILIPLRKEIEHVQSYLTIQTIRYKNQFTYTIDVDSSLLNCRIPKITLQPFIENALYHGIERMADEGEIAIKAKDQGENILLEIKDDGVGIHPEELEWIQKFERNETSGFGIWNVHQRIQLLYGKEYGVSIQSELDEGTTVHIMIPKNKDHSSEPSEGEDK